MKIICVDNFGREHVADRLVAESVNEYYGTPLVDFLNNRYSGEESSCYYRLVNDDHKLWRGMEELV
jgi:hypothetical protein